MEQTKLLKHTVDEMGVESEQNKCEEKMSVQFILPNEADMSNVCVEQGTSDSETGGQADIHKELKHLFYIERAEYKDIILDKPGKMKTSLSKTEERSSARRTGRVDRPMDLVYSSARERQSCNTAGHSKVVPTESHRCRNFSEASYFSKRPSRDVEGIDDACCDVTSGHDRICPSRLSGYHGRYSVDNVTNPAAIKCLRWRMRRNALCDPLRLLLPQYVREKLERENEKRKSSVARKVSRFMTVSFDLDRDEDLI